MGYLGKIIGGSAGFFLGGPVGAIVGAALGHAADAGALPKFRLPMTGPSVWADNAAKPDQVYAVSVVVLAAKLSRCDGPVVRAEIDAFKRMFRIPEGAARDIGRLFDHARDSSDEAEPFAARFGAAFAANPSVLEETLTALFEIARADKPLTRAELDFLRRAHHAMGLDDDAWDRAWRGSPGRRFAADAMEDAYAVLGVPPDASAETIRARWRALARDHHPDTLAARGVPAEIAAKATEQAARINAAWDRIKRGRGL